MEIQDTAQVLAAGDFALFVGAEEDTHLEVKSQPYDLTNNAHDRYELAKDVASLANSKGGYLLIGLATAPLTDKPVDAVTGLALITAAAFVERQYTGIINDHIYPRIEGLVVEFRLSAGAADGLGTILVPPQDDDQKPFIIAKVVDDGTYLKQIVVGYAERLGASNEPLSPARLQQTFKKGQDSHSQRLTRVEQKLDDLLERGAATEVPQRRGEAEPNTFDRNALEARINAPIADVKE